MNELINYIIENKMELLDIIAKVIAIFAIICALTPTPRDDKILGKIYKVFENLLLLTQAIIL